MNTFRYNSFESLYACIHGSANDWAPLVYIIHYFID